MSKFTNEQLSTIIELWKDSCISSIVTSNYEKFKTMADAFNVIYPNACVSGKIYNLINVFSNCLILFNIYVIKFYF